MSSSPAVEFVILIVLLTVVVVVVLLIIAYFTTMCVSSLLESRKQRNNPTPVARRSVHSRASGAGGERRTMGSQRRATSNSYITNPTATAEAQRVRPFTARDFPSSQGHTRITLPTNLFLNSHGLFLDGRQGESGGSELEVMRFYTAEELLNFNFDEQINEAAGPRSGSRSVSMTPPAMNSISDFLSPMVAPTPENPMFLRHPDTFLNPTETRAMENARVQGRNRLCYSIPASYIGRPPAYLPTDDHPPAYTDVVKLSKIPEEEQPPQLP